jgi:hypothetical protein
VYQIAQSFTSESVKLQPKKKGLETIPDELTDAARRMNPSSR